MKTKLPGQPLSYGKVSIVPHPHPCQASLLSSLFSSHPKASALHNDSRGSRTLLHSTRHLGTHLPLSQPVLLTTEDSLLLSSLPGGSKVSGELVFDRAGSTDS